MYKNQSLAIVVPCYNEETQIEKVLSTLPDYVDRVYIIDDKSQDKTIEVAQNWISNSTTPEKYLLIAHEKNSGVGAAIASGYKKAAEEEIDVAVVMAGDAQMAPEDLPDIIAPVIDEGYDYSKGNRLFTGDAWNMIPRVRYIGNSLLSLLTKVASGYWHIADSQSGYTAINKKALKTIHWDNMYKRYGQPNDLLVKLNIYNFKVKDVPVAPVYNVGEQSGVKPIRMIPRLAFLLLRLFLYRMKEKYIIRDFHPLLFFYLFGFLLFIPGTLLGLDLVITRILGYAVAETSALFAAFLSIMGVQFLLFAMWFDMESNKNLK